MASLLIALLRAYQRFVAPLLPQVCRFHPTCSTYAVEAIRRHGALRGLALTTARLARCAPWHAGGLDPVP
jgi:putative membrane protein insertion efficiency factor